MKPKYFLNQIDHDRILQAIQTAENGNTGDIVLMINHSHVQDPLKEARKAYKKLGLGHAPGQNSFLIFIAPKTQKFSLVGGTALHEKMGQPWWDSLSGLLSSCFKEGKFTDGIVLVIEKAGEALKMHFPADTADRTGQKDIVEET